MDAGARTQSWASNVVTAPGADALVYPGGRLLVQSGLLATGLTDEEVGGLLAHVLAHALLGHERRRLEEAIPPTEAQSVDPNRRALAVAGALPELLQRRATDGEIAAADRASVELLARAAYPPKAAASAWRKLAPDTPLARRYPVNEPRLAALEAAAAAAQPLFEETRARAEAAPRQEMPATTGAKRGVR
jgi:predicted Zn-dependent protease